MRRAPGRAHSMWEQSAFLLSLLPAVFAFTRPCLAPARMGFVHDSPVRRQCLPYPPPRRAVILLAGKDAKDMPFGDDMAGRGDLRNGMDEERNAQIAALKKTFYSSTDSEPKSKEPDATSSDKQSDKQVSLLGVLQDMPLCRWEMMMLPGFNSVLNVWQPMYVHMFETIIAQDEPWYYVHLQTPG